MKYSYKLRINGQRVRPDGTAALFHQVLIDAKKTTVPLELYWPADKFDPATSTILPRKRADTVYEDYCLTINRQAHQINEVFIWARLANVTLTIESFHRELANQSSRHDFIQFWERTVEENELKGLISAPTAVSHRSSLMTLRTYRPELPFNQLDLEFLNDYKTYMYRQLGSNTVWKKLKEMRTYVNLARSKGYIFDYPFEGFKMPVLTNRLEYLNEREFGILRDHYHSPELDKDHVLTLRAFLFACYTGLRISDLMVVSWRELRSGTLTFTPQKRTREIMPTVSIPLHAAALALIPTKKGVLMPTVVEQSMNRTIKVICGRLGLSQATSFHWARHTFATRFLRHGGGIEVLQQLLGHKKIETTMIYVHVDEERKRADINKMPA